MVKTIRVSEEFHELVEAHKGDGETMEDALRRMFGGPDPRVLVERGLVGGEENEAAAEKMREAIERKREHGRDRRAELRERLE